MYIYHCNDCMKTIKGRSMREECSYCGSRNIVQVGIPLTEINGLDSYYEEKLMEAGITVVSELTRSDIEILFKAADISRKILAKFIREVQILDPTFEYMFEPTLKKNNRAQKTLDSFR